MRMNVAGFLHEAIVRLPQGYNSKLENPNSVNSNVKRQRLKRNKRVSFEIAGSTDSFLSANLAIF